MIIVSKEWIKKHIARIKPRAGLVNQKNIVLQSGETNFITTLTAETKKKVEQKKQWRWFRIYSKGRALYCMAYYKYARKRYDRPNYNLRANISK